MILIRRNYSDNSYAETRPQARVRKTKAALGVIGLGTTGAGLAYGHTYRKGKEKIIDKITEASMSDEIGNQIRRGFGMYSRERYLHNYNATTKFAKNGTKKVEKAMRKNAVKGALAGTAIGAGLYALSRKSLIKRNEKKNELSAKTLNKKQG